MSKPIVITIEECFEKYQQLDLGNYAFQKKAKASDESLQNIQQILESSGLKVLPIPQDINEAIKWKSEKKRIQSAYLRMINGLKNRKFAGNFFDSSNYSVFAQVRNQNQNQDENEDPTYQVLFGLQSNQGRTKTRHSGRL